MKNWLIEKLGGVSKNLGLHLTVQGVQKSGIQRKTRR